VKKLLVLVDLVATITRMQLSEDPRLLERYTNVLERMSVFAPDAASRLAAPIVNAIDAGFERSVGGTEAWLAVIAEEDPKLQSYFAMRERLRAVAIGGASAD
jgi:hypothetical protein